MTKFRALRPSEVDVRVGTVSKTGTGVSLLLYKDARCDMAILDETVGAMNWQRKHTRDNANCTVEIWDKEKSQWIGKEDTGTESFTEKEKGLASDSFKRACFNWGIGRELYTSGFIWVNAADTEIKKFGDKYTCSDNFHVSKMEVDEDTKTISILEIKNKKGKVVFHAENINKNTQLDKLNQKKEEPEEPKTEPKTSAEPIDKSCNLTIEQVKEALLKNKVFSDWLKTSEKDIDKISELKLRKQYNAMV